MSVSGALQVVQVAVSLGFFGLGLLTVADWLRQREPSRGYLALALGALGLTSLISQINTISGYRLPLIQGISLVLFMVSGYALLLFRGSFISLSRQFQIGALVASVVTTVGVLLIGLPSNPAVRPTPLQSAATLALILVWSACVVEPVVRLWMASRHRPAVQRARLRALGAGYMAIVFILLIAGVAGSAVRNPVVAWLLEAIVITALPLLYVSFAPPKWLRRLWRQTEEEQLRDAIHDLVLFSPDRRVLASRAAEWALRLVGADGVAIIDANQDILAARGLDAGTAQGLAKQTDPKGRPQLLATPGSVRQNAILMPLALDTGMGAMVLVSGPFTPYFGSDEVARLRGYAANIIAALDRARVTERLAELEKTKSQFLNLASHELRSPLGVINGYLSMLEQGSLGQLKESGIRAVEVLKAKALEMNLLVAQMLDAARLEDGRLALKRERLDLRLVVHEALEMVRPLTTPRHELMLETTPAAVMVFGDTDRITTIVGNLLENAIKYSPEGGKVHCAVTVAGSSAVVAVRDEGVGISPEDLARLFGRFERLQNRETSHVGGTGLGLYLSRELARQHGGDLSVESTPGAGSRFALSLPLAGPAHEAVPVAAEPEPTAPRLRVVADQPEAEQLA
jgi:signal transduction histidine kinase